MSKRGNDCISRADCITTTPFLHQMVQSTCTQISRITLSHSCPDNDLNPTPPMLQTAIIYWLIFALFPMGAKGQVGRLVAQRAVLL